MKVAVQMFSIFVIGPVVAVALLYGAFAFVNFDMSWAAHARSMDRGAFVFMALFAAGFGFLGAAWLCSTLD